MCLIGGGDSHFARFRALAQHGLLLSDEGLKSSLSWLQLGRYGGLADELDNLKRDRVLLVEELKRQRQRQQVKPSINDFTRHSYTGINQTLSLSESSEEGTAWNVSFTKGMGRCNSILQESELEMRGLQLRVENMERQHQQTMSFLSKALQNPGFLQQILQARGASQIAGMGTEDFW